MLHILDAITDPGHEAKPNEDAFGHGLAHAWVIDGATGVADDELLDAPSDAHWLAREASAYFAAHAEQHGSDLTGLTRSAIEELARRFEAGRRREPKGRYELPSAAMTLVHSDGARLRCANFADCRLVLLADDGETTILGDHHLDREASGPPSHRGTGRRYRTRRRYAFLARGNALSARFPRSSEHGRRLLDSRS